MRVRAMRIGSHLMLVGCGVFLVPPSTLAQKIYWTRDEGYVGAKIIRSNLDGTDQEDLVVTKLMLPGSIVVDAQGGKLYFGDDIQRGRLVRANLDGSRAEIIIAPQANMFFYVGDVALDPVERKIYWSLPVISRKIQRSNYDGTQVEDLPLPGQSVYNVEVDAIGRRLYWSSGSISRSTLDGANVETIVIPAQGAAGGMALDAIGGKIYWMESQAQRIRRANLDGTGIEDLVVISNFPTAGVVLDVPRARMYWMDGSPGVIMRANLDGSQPEPLVYMQTCSSWRMAVDEINERIYWSGNTSIWSADLDGQDIQGVIVTEQMEPWSITLDMEDNRMYWADRLSFKIRRSNLDGSDIQDLANTFPQFPIGLALDRPRGKVYWTEYHLNCIASNSDGNIRRADLDGANVETLVEGGIGWPVAIDLDLVNDAMYFVTDWFLIRRANLDGTNVTPIRTTGGSTETIALDAAAGKMYYGVANYDTYWFVIRRCNLNGFGQEDLVTEEATSLKLDLAAGKIYWDGAFSPSASLSRANLDGTQEEVLIYDWARSVAVDPRVPGDCKGDQAITMTEDWPSFFNCFGGPGVEFTPGCACADPNGDRDVDLRDFADLQPRLVPSE